MALVFVLLTVATNLPHLRATLAPPAGTRFVGVFYSIPDVYNYFSYMQQGEDGFFFLADKLSLDPEPARLVNLEWWAVGRFSAVTGLGLPLSFRFLGLVASLALVAGVARWLARAGLAPTHALGGLLLVFFGGGFGGLLFLWLGPPAWRFSDLTSGLFPVVSILVNPHFVTGTALLVWSVLGLNGGGRGTAAGLVAGNILGLSRPYDLVLVVGIRLGTVAVTVAPSQWVRAVLPLAGLLPSVAVNYWIFFHSRSFQGFKQSSPDLGTFALAIAPALLLAAVAMHTSPPPNGPARIDRAALVIWVVVVLVSNSLLTIPFPFMSQSAVNVGVPLLGLAALGLSHRQPRILLCSALACSTTGLVAIKLLLEDNPSWFVRKERLEVAMALQPWCRPGEIVMAPPEIGMYANAYSSCRTYITHAIAPDSAVRTQEMTSFYLESPPQARLALLDRRCVSHLILSGGDLDEPTSVLGVGSGFRLSARAGTGRSALAIYSRNLPPDCTGPRKRTP